ncbi:hypothetical protein I316_05852 [Kwoniella heveanensis BCC8398]|uniref:DUF1996 domain-containing protein n=1 Tax=Kwoniella heveanensis BCC8398 TaxID=1296120 RepID=A0A1B9GN19_9TREE|nr:hypothetical protein I316_05852 [Kwoniella heveanensis BCC8398]
MRTSLATLVVGALATLTAFASAGGKADHFIITNAQTLTISRLDPIVNDGDLSAHAHRVVGASNFNAAMNSFATQTSASCTTNIVGADKSNYWAPQLYYRHPNNTFSPILGSTRVYYFVKSSEVKPFPPGFRMISGSSMKRALDEDPALGIKISCNHGLQTQWLPNGTSHPDGCTAVAMGIFFPSCGLADGTIDSDDHFSHMTWPVKWLGPNLVKDVNGVTCPESHPIKYPTIFAQFNYYLDEDHPWRNDECTLVLSNGDCTGNNFHADFVNGWAMEDMTEILQECGYGKAPGQDLDQCEPLKRTKSIANSWECRYEGKLPDEEVGLYRPIPKLPGCNPLWKDGVDEKPTCESTPKPGMVVPNAYFENLKFRNKIPIALPEVTDDVEIIKYIPATGDTGASRLGRWGTDGSNQDKLKVGTWQDIMDSLAPDAVVPDLDNKVALPTAGDMTEVEPSASEAASTTAEESQATSSSSSSVAHSTVSPAPQATEAPDDGSYGESASNLSISAQIAPSSASEPVSVAEEEANSASTSATETNRPISSASNDPTSTPAPASTTPPVLAADPVETSTETKTSEKGGEVSASPETCK